MAGVYDNAIVHNVITNNGLKGEGAGVLFANAGPGTASYNNLVEGNFIAGNELSGVTMHAHTLAPGQHEYLSGNKVIGNRIGTNNTGGDPLDFPASPKDTKTTGVLVFSGGTPVQTVIARNHISDNYDRHLAQPAGAGVRPPHECLPPREHAGFGRSLIRAVTDPKNQETRAAARPRSWPGRLRPARRTAAGG